MNNTIIGIGIVAFFLAATGLIMLQENRAKQRRFFKRCQEAWGKVPQREYTSQELYHISRYFYGQKKEGFYIDDITWNDLDLDRIFMLLNQSVSAVGDGCLYALLRTPLFEETELNERSQLMEFFRKEEVQRKSIQQLLSKIRKQGSTSFYEAVSAAQEANLQGGKSQMLFLAAFAASLLAFILAPSKGVFVFLGVCVVNIVTYMAKKQEIDLYLTSFRCVLQLLTAQKELEKLNIPALSKYTERGEQYQKGLSGFLRGSSFVVNRSSAGGGLEGMVMDYVRMLTHIDLIKFYHMLHAMQAHGDEILGLMEIFGYLDNMLSLASYREMLSTYTIPVFVKEKEASMEVKDLYHPLISHPVANSIQAKGGILLTGSNASGKSTFLKNLAVNALLAQTTDTCTASFYCAPFFKIMTSMSLRDDLESGESYYIVEIRSIKRILDETQKQGFLLCIIDEVLRGTNTIERIGASSEILKQLRRENVLAFAATHDIELTYILEQWYENYHFEEEIQKQDVIFSYLLKPGRVCTRNAIRLLEASGYDKKLVQGAKNMVKSFEKTGIWKELEKY